MQSNHEAGNEVSSTGNNGINGEANSETSGGGSRDGEVAPSESHGSETGDGSQPKGGPHAGPKHGALPAVLLVTGHMGAMACAAEVATAVPCTIEVVENKKQALVALRRAEFAAVVVDEGVAEDDEESGEQLWRATGMAVPVQVNFAISSAKRLVRELRAALHRQQLEQSRARETTLAVMKAEVGSALTGILLELELLAGMAQIPPEGQERLRHIAGLTTALRRKLDVGNAAAMAQSIRAREVQRETVRQALLDRREAARSAASKTTTVMAGTDPAGTTTPKLQAPGSPSTEPLMS